MVVLNKYVRLFIRRTYVHGCELFQYCKWQSVGYVTRRIDEKKVFGDMDEIFEKWKRVREDFIQRFHLVVKIYIFLLDCFRFGN